MTKLLEFTAVISILLLMECCDAAVIEGKYGTLHNKNIPLCTSLYLYFFMLIENLSPEKNSTQSYDKHLPYFEILRGRDGQMVVMESLDLVDFKAGMERMD